MSTRAFEYNLGPLSRIPEGEGKQFLIGGVRVAVFRSRDGRVWATQADCPHRGGPLADGMVGGRTLVCPLHGYKFDLATGAPLGHVCAALRTHPVRVGGHDEVLLTLLPEASLADALCAG